MKRKIKSSFEVFHHYYELDRLGAIGFLIWNYIWAFCEIDNQKRLQFFVF